MNFVYGPVSSVGIATELQAGRSGIESRRGRDFPPIQTGPGVPPSLLHNGYRVFVGGRGGRSVGLTHHPHLVPKFLEKSRAIPLLTQRACVAYKKCENLPTSTRAARNRNAKRRRGGCNLTNYFIQSSYWKCPKLTLLSVISEGLEK